MIPIDPVRYPQLVLALGGNALIRPGEAGTLEEVRRRIRGAMASTADLVTAGFAAVITHGNGPMVGHLLLQMECARAVVPPMPLFISRRRHRRQSGLPDPAVPGERTASPRARAGGGDGDYPGGGGRG